jgi:putative ABC transport system permease protein
MVFFLPLGLAIVHMAVAFPVLCKLLSLFGMVNVPLFLLCAAGSILLFTLLYFITYQLTARTYYRIVQSGVS